MPYCCEVFPKIAKRFEWVNAPQEQYNLPVLAVDEFEAYRVNFCPSCGADIRGIVISKDEFDKLK